MSEAMKLAIEYYLTDERVSKAVSNIYRQREHEVLRLENENERLREFVKKVASHDFELSGMCSTKVNEAARKLLGWPIKEGGQG
tara:strand:+ start:855 stop:1106 length:252 start_codon:yes stop_codon:yes gene_type:complete